jgi:hypothetical protein
VRIWDPATGTALAAVRVDAWLAALALTSQGIAAAGERGPYLFQLTLDATFSADPVAEPRTDGPPG